jgi:O-antigen/teichoic acid export membrane protein
MRAAGFPERPERSGSVPDPRQESLARRDDRNVAELVQELRVVSLGVQVLFGFLLSLPFTVRFSRLGTGQRDLYLASLVLSAISTVLLLGPVAYHRMVFRRGLKESLVRYANVMAILGLVAVGAAVLTAVLLVTSVVAGALPGALISAVMACMLVGLWFVLPLARRADE